MYLLARPPVQPKATRSTCPAPTPSASPRTATATTSSTYTLTRLTSRTTRTA